MVIVRQQKLSRYYKIIDTMCLPIQKVGDKLYMTLSLDMYMKVKIT